MNPARTPCFEHAGVLGVGSVEAPSHRCQSRRQVLVCRGWEPFRVQSGT